MIRSVDWRALAWGSGGTLVTGVLLAIGWHVWTDHVAFHQLLLFINQYGAKIQALP